MQISGGAGAAQAAQIQQWRDRMFSRADSDQSGGLSLEEYSQVAARRQNTQSANSAGTPASSSQSLSSPVGGPPGSAVRDACARLDSNGDGNISQAELAAARPSEPRGQFQSDTFSALLSSQGQSRPRHSHSHRGEGQGDPSLDRPDPATQRRLAAYTAQQATAQTGGGTTLTA